MKEKFMESRVEHKKLFSFFLPFPLFDSTASFALRRKRVVKRYKQKSLKISSQINLRENIL